MEKIKPLLYAGYFGSLSAGSLVGVKSLGSLGKYLGELIGYNLDKVIHPNTLEHMSRYTAETFASLGEIGGIAAGIAVGALLAPKLYFSFLNHLHNRGSGKWVFD